MPSHYSPCPHYNTPFPSYSASPHSNTLQPSCCSLPTYSHNHSSQGHSPIIYHNSSSPSTHLQSRTHYLPRTVSPLHVSHSMNGYHTPQLHSSSMRYKPALRSISVFEKLESSSEEDTEDAEDPFDILAEIPGKSKTRSHYNDVQPRKKSVRSKSSKKHPKRSSQSFEVVNVSDSNEEQSNDKIEDPFELLPDIPCKAETVSHGCHTPQLCPSTHQSYCSVQQKKEITSLESSPGHSSQYSFKNNEESLSESKEGHGFENTSEVISDVGYNPMSSQPYDSSNLSVSTMSPQCNLQCHSNPTSPVVAAQLPSGESTEDNEKQSLTGNLESSLSGNLSTSIVENSFPTNGSEKPSATKVTRLINWYVKKIRSSFIVVGNKEEDRLPQSWHSGPIVELMSPRDLMTKSRALYCLIGPPDELSMLKQGYTQECIKMFEDGFPEFWKSLLLDTVKSEGKKSDPKEPVPSDSDTNTLSDTSTSKSSSVNTSIKKGDSSVLSSIEETFVSSLKRSSRGRLLKPVFDNIVDGLGKYKGYSYNCFGEFTGFSTPVIDLTNDDDPTPETKKQSVLRKPKIEKLPETRQLKYEESSEDIISDVNTESSQKKVNESTKTKTVKKSEARNISCSSSGVQRRKKRACICMPNKKPLKYSDKNDSKKETGMLLRNKVKKFSLNSEEESSDLSRNKTKELKTFSLPLVKISGRKNKQKEKNEDIMDGCLSNEEWNNQTLLKLRSTVASLPALTTNFWGKVAQKMGNHFSASDCQNRYLEMGTKTGKQKERFSKKGKEPLQKGDDGKMVITGRRGTMKRKRQLRSALEHIDDDYSDDVFESTPMKKRMKRVKFSFNNDDIFQSQSEATCSSSSSTDSGLYTPSSYRHRLGAPVTHTPKLNEMISSPDLQVRKKRRAADSIVHRYHKSKPTERKHIRMKSSGKSVIVSHKPSTKSEGLANKHLMDIRTGERRTLKIFEDSDDDDDNDETLSDIEEEYHKIISFLH